MVSVYPSRSNSRDPIATVTRWLVLVLGICCWVVAVIVAVLVLTRAESVVLRAVVLLVFLPLVLAYLIRGRGVVVQRITHRLVQHPLVLVAFGAVFTVGSVLALLAQEHWSGFIITALLISSLGATVANFAKLPEYHILPDRGDRSCRCPSGLVPSYATRPIWLTSAVFLESLGFKPSDSLRLGELSRGWLLSTVRQEGASSRINSRCQSRQVRKPILCFAEFRDEKGHRVVLGQSWVAFRPQQQVVSVHFPFWPPFESVPKVRVWHGAKTRVQFGKIYPFGMRLDVRLPSPPLYRTGIPVRFCAKENA
mgnify:CR=1 FL=1